jgi:hypothetical protein
MILAQSLNISTVNEETLQALDSNVDTHNLGEERNVDLTYYEVSIRGNKNLASASRKVVLNRSMDLIEENPIEFKKYKTAANIMRKFAMNGKKK